MEFDRTGAGPHNESLGTTKLYVNDQVVAEGPMKTQSGKFGDGLAVGGGTIQFVGVTVEEAAYTDLEAEAQRALMAD